MFQKSNRSGLRGEQRFKGLPLSPGVAMGRPCLYFHAQCADLVADHLPLDPVVQRKRLNESVAWLVHRMDGLATEVDIKVGVEQADIFRSLRMLLEDESLQARLVKLIEDYGLSAEEAVDGELGRYQEQLQKAQSEYLRSRSEDLADIRRELLGRLSAETPHRLCRDMVSCDIGRCPLGNDHIATVSQLTPNLVMEVDTHTCGLLAQSGGVNSHAAILARALRLPAVSGISNLYRKISAEADLLINGDTGEVIVNPSPDTIQQLKRRVATGGLELGVHPPIAALRVLATLDTTRGIEAALKVRAEGVGLYRTEMEALRAGRVPTEGEQENRYAAVVKAMAPHPVYIRLFDFGGDKTLSGDKMPAPQSGDAIDCRGAQYLLTHPGLLKTQARALARASRQGLIYVTYPMITDVEQFRHMRDAFETAVADIPSLDLVHGVMLEIPSACLQARQMLREADFGCVGTNDLIQYLFGQPRSEQGPSAKSWSEHPVLWRIMEIMVDASQENGKPLSICGELASEPGFVSQAIDIGINTISTNPADVAGIRKSLQ